MNCRTCACTLPTEALACPHCGSSTPLYYSRSASSPHTATVVPTVEADTLPVSPARSGAAPSYAPAAFAGLPFYTSTVPAAGCAANPYEEALPPPPPPPASRGSCREARGGVLVGLAVLLVLAGFIATLRLRANPAGVIQSRLTAGTAQLAATATALASLNPYRPFTGTLVLDNPLRERSAGSQWSEGRQPGNALCSFSAGAYHLSLAGNGDGYCGPQAKGLVFSNLAFEANVTLLQGDYAGIWFRFDRGRGTRYLFFMDAQGDYGLDTDENGVVTSLRAGSRPDAFRLGHQTNLLAIVATGTTIAMYVNHQLLASITDTSYQQGQIGVCAEGLNGGFDSIFSDVRVWKL